jgi:hypothetical protein
MISINTTVVKKAFIEFEPEIKAYSKIAYDNLLSLSKENSLDSHKKIFLDKLLKFLKYKDIMSLTIDEISKLKIQLNEVPPTKKSKSKKTFKNKIIEALNYNELRSEFLPKYFNSIGIKACVYCNSQHTLSVNVNSFTKTGKKRKERKWVAKFQVDHHLPQSEYPYLSICLFNFYPSCATCNNIKGKNNIDFALYQDKITEKGYLFSLDLASKSRYSTNYKSEELIINFYDPIKKNIISHVPQSFEDTFHITKIYNTQKDLAEELLLKSIIYNKEYKQTLFDNFSKVVPKPELFNRFLIGNYCEPEEIHKRPMAKFMQDIAKDVGLI